MREYDRVMFTDSGISVHLLVSKFRGSLTPGKRSRTIGSRRLLVTQVGPPLRTVRSTRKLPQRLLKRGRPFES